MTFGNQGIILWKIKERKYVGLMKADVRSERSMQEIDRCIIQNSFVVIDFMLMLNIQYA